MTPEAIMLFAAGLGTRMRPLTETCPKPLIPVAGRALIDHALDHLADLPGLRAVANTHYLPDQIAAHLAGREVALSHEEILLETGGGLRAALPLLGAGPVFTMNTDALWLDANPLRVLSQAWDGTAEALLLLTPSTGRGDFAMEADGRLTRGGPFTYTGAQIIETPRVRDFPEVKFSLNTTWDAMIGAGGLRGVVFPGRWLDVGTPEALARAEALLSGP